MESKYGFTKMSLAEFEAWIAKNRIARTIRTVQQHHTYLPNYSHFHDDNHFRVQRGMKNHHVNSNGWSDIGQHFTIFPDGKVATGRSLERNPAGIKYNNAQAICIENLGFFDENKDDMTQAQKDGIVKITAALCKRFSIPVNTDRIVYHHWFDARTGNRTNGFGNGWSKSCPGTNFFGGNKVADCKKFFIPLVENAINGTVTENILPELLKYGSVTADTLNVRKGARTKFSIIGKTIMGAIIRIYEEKNNWYKISATKEEWVYSKYVEDVERAIVNVDDDDFLSVRTGPSVKRTKIGEVYRNQDVFIYDEENNWSKIGTNERWVSNKYLTFPEDV